MAFETLKDLKEVNGHTVHRVEWKQPKDSHIEINDECNAITFKIQDGPIKECGVNGCQVTDMIAVSLKIIQGLQAKFPCRENAITITKLEEALMWQEARTKDREKRNVEGFNKK